MSFMDYIKTIDRILSELRIEIVRLKTELRDSRLQCEQLQAKADRLWLDHPMNAGRSG